MGSRRSKSEVSGDPPTTHPLAVTPPDHLPRQTCRFVHPGTVSRKVVLYGPRTVPQVVHTRTLTTFIPLVSHINVSSIKSQPSGNNSTNTTV